MTEKIKIVTHNGNFHADEVFGVATLLSIYPDAEIVRSRDPEEIERGDIVLDVGGVYDHSAKRYDHHQKGGSGKRENGIPYAAFGLIWKHYGEELCDSKEVWEKIDQKLVQPLDAGDCGFEICKTTDPDYTIVTADSLIGLYNPSWKEDAKIQDDQFMKVVGIAKDIISRSIKKAEDAVEGNKVVRELYEKSEDKEIIFLENGYPWKDVLVDYPEPKFVIFKDKNSEKFLVQAVPVAKSGFEVRVNFPKEWGGLSGDKLEDVSGIAGASFCHNNLFFVATFSKESAFEVAKKALEYNK